MAETLCYLFFTITLVSGFVYLRLRDKKYFQKDLTESMRSELKEEIQSEEYKHLSKKKNFEKALGKYKI